VISIPIYEYLCTSCNKSFSILQKSYTQKIQCNKCGGKLEKLISKSNFHLKGDGWYKPEKKEKKDG